MLSYLKSKSQHLGEKYSTREKIIVGVLQGSILGSLLFNIFVNDIFHLENRSFFFFFTDDNDLYPFGINAEEGKQNLIQDHLKLSEWQYGNCIILNQKKSHNMCLGKDSVGDLLKFCRDDLEVGKLETVLGIQLDNKLN